MSDVKYVEDKWFGKYTVQMQYIDAFGDVTFFPAFLQPLRYKNKMYLGGARTNIGFEGRKKFLMIYPAAVELPDATYDDSVMLYGGYRYVFDRVESVYVGNKIIYNWAIVQKGAVYIE